MCPADRFFEVTSALKKTIEEGVKENVLEMALKGHVSSPFYMVGRMNGQSVVLNVEKGKLKLRVDGEAKEAGKEVVYSLNGRNNIHGKEESDGSAEEGSQGIELGVSQRGDAMPGSVIGMDTIAETGGSMPGVFDQVDDASAVAGAGDGGDASSVGAAGELGERPGLKSAPSLPFRETGAGLPAEGDGKFPETGGTAVAVAVTETGKDEGTCGGFEVVERKEVYERENASRGGSEGASASLCDLGSQKREADGDGGSSLIGDIEAMLLRLGAPGAVRDDGGASQSGGGPSGGTGGGSGKESDEGTTGSFGTGERSSSSVSLRSVRCCRLTRNGGIDPSPDQKKIRNEDRNGSKSGGSCRGTESAYGATLWDGVPGLWHTGLHGSTVASPGGLPASRALSAGAKEGGAGGF
jgi:hypothetical protein